jgi:acetyl esterase/lipase
MYSGLALLMDVYHPENSNGIGVIYIRGTGWHTPLSLDADPLNLNLVANHPQAALLLENGYTVFGLNHRLAPRFHYPDSVEDVQRAVRFVRYHANRYGIDPNRIGAVGTSAGAYHVSMLGLLNGDGETDDPSLINRESAKVQAVVGFATPTDFTAHVGPAETSYLGTWVQFWETPERMQEENSVLSEASPATYVSPDDPPFLLVHGDADDVVPFSQSEILERKLVAAGVPAELIRVPGGVHAYSGYGDQEMVEWLDKHLLNSQ